MPQSQITEEEIKQSEVLRYLGYRGQKADETIMEQITRALTAALPEDTEQTENAVEPDPR